jgi:hypothetical protein
LEAEVPLHPHWTRHKGITFTAQGFPSDIDTSPNDLETPSSKPRFQCLALDEPSTSSGNLTSLKLIFIIHIQINIFIPQNFMIKVNLIQNKYVTLTFLGLP